MTRLISIAAAAAAALALAAPAVADVKASRPGDSYRDYAKDAFAKDAFRLPPASGSWTSVRPGGTKWASLRPHGDKWSIGVSSNSWN